MTVALRETTPGQGIPGNFAHRQRSISAINNKDDNDDIKKLCYGLSGSLFLASSLLTISSHAATDSIGLTVTTDVEMGTCTSTLTDDGSAKLSAINFGDVYISEINAETKIKTFKLQFKDCAGIPGKKAKIELTPRALCEGNSNNGPGFANASTAAAKSSGGRR